MQIYRSQLIKASLIIIILITGLVYLKTASFGFVNWDDNENIRTNVRYKELNYDNMQYHFQHSRYKALAIWSFMADARLFGDKATGFHLHNVLLHIVNILLVFFLVRKLAQKDIIALITAGLFALHPVFVEPVAWVTGRKDLLFVLFSLMAIMCYLRYLEKKYKLWWLLAVIVLVYLASLAKIQAATIPLILLALDWFYKRKISLELILEKLLLFVLIFDKWTIFYVFIVLFLLVHGYKYFRVWIQQKISREHISKLFFWYLVIISFLISLFFVRFFDSDKINVFVVVLISVSFYTLCCIWALKNKQQIINHISRISDNKKTLLFFVSIIIFLFQALIIEKINNLVSLATTWNLWTITPGSENFFTLGERLILAPNSLLYYVSRFFLFRIQDPMIPYPEQTDAGMLPAGMLTTGIIVYIVFAVIAFLLFRYFRKNRLVLLGFLWFLASISVVMHIFPIEGRVLAADRYAYPAYIGLFMILGTASDYLMQRFKKTYIIAGMIIITLILSIKTYTDLGTWKSSKTLWERALSVNPKNHYAMYSLSLACFAEEKNPEKALKYLDNAINLKEDFQYFNNRGRIRYAVKDLQGAIEDFDKSIKIDSNSYAAYNNRGAVKQQLGNFKPALTDYNKAIALSPKFEEAVNNRKKVLHLIYIDSILIYKLAIPPDVQSELSGYIEKISQICINKKDFEKASFYLSKGISLYPDQVSFHEKLAVMYQLNKAYDKALEAYNSGLFYLPLDPTLLLGRGILFMETGDTVRACDDFRVSAAKGNPDAGNLSRRFCW